MSEDLEGDFEAYVLSKLDEAEMQLGFVFSGLRSLIGDKGAAGAARYLLDPANIGHPFQGFRRMAENALVNCSIEAAVVQFQDSGLFARPIIETAKVRLLLASRIRSQK
jgi:hypothetical protein